LQRGRFGHGFQRLGPLGWDGQLVLVRQARAIASHAMGARHPLVLPESQKLRGLDLFAGAGGLSCGFEWAGGTVVGGVEIDRYAAATFAANHPQATVWTEDIRSLTPRQISREIGPIDVLMGGPMCQGVSQRGPRDPHDERNFAFWEYIDFVRELRPPYFVMENVPALASDVHNRELAIAVFEEIESLGYNISADVVLAAWLGVPQLRYRLIVMGALDGLPAFPQDVARGIGGLLGESDFLTVSEAIMDLPPVEAGGGSDAVSYPRPSERPPKYAAMLRKGAKTLFNHWSADTDEVNLRRIRFVPEGGNWHDIPVKYLPARFQHVRPSDHTTTYRRLDRDHPAHVITTECGNVTSGAFTHPTQHRAITVREAARLQSFPDRFRFVGPRGSQYRQVGNAVPPLIAKGIFESLLGLAQPSSFHGRLSAAVLRQSTGKRLPFVLAPRYRMLFGASSGVRRRAEQLKVA
jgi:DNA (cytosine-5)-methyltransferase 1